MRHECRDRFPTRKVSDPDIHQGTCVMHVPWWMPGSLTSSFLWSRCGENVPGIPGACATRNFTYLVRGPWSTTHFCNETSTVYWCMASNLKALRNLYLNKIYIYIYVGLSVCNICTIFMYRIAFLIVQLFRPWVKHNGLQNPIRVLRCMVNSDS